MTPDEIIQKEFSWRKRNLPWYPRKGRRRHLPPLLAKLGVKVGVEIGTREGIFAEAICRANPSVKLYCVDPWKVYPSYSESRTQSSFDAKYAEAQQRLKDYNVELIRKTSLEAVKDFNDESLDFIHIDGNHTFDFFIVDLVFWAPKVRAGGLILIHDYGMAGACDVPEGVLGYTRSHNITPWYVTREEVPSAFWIKKPEHASYGVI